MRGLRTWAVCCLENLQKLNWFPIIKTRDLAPLKITHKALYDDVWPDYLRLKFHIGTKLAIPTERDTFQDSAARLFNTLPDRLRQEPDYKKFIRLAKKFMFSKGESIWQIIIIIIILTTLFFNCTYFYIKPFALILNLLYTSFLI